MEKSPEQLADFLAVEIAAVRYMVKWGIYKDVIEAVDEAAEPLQMTLDGHIRGKVNKTLEDLLEPLKRQMDEFK